MVDGVEYVSARGTEDLVAGQFVPVMELHVRVSSDGTTNTFRIPTAQYTAEKVDAIVGAWYEQHRRIFGT